MASPRRARSLFLSPDKAELLAAKELNNLVHRVEVIPRKPVPRQGRRTDIVVERSAGDESRMSTTSTINTVDAFCREYRPPSVALHRLSSLDKELPPPPPSETPNQILTHGNAISRTSTQKNAAAQTIISIQSRYSTRIKPSTPSRLSTISSQHICSQHISSQQRDSEDRISIRSHFSTQEIPTDQAVPSAKPRASLAIDRRRPSIVGDVINEEVKRRRSGSISPGTVSHQENNPAAAVHEIPIPIPGRQEADIDPRACQDIGSPLTGTDSKEIVLRSKSKHKPSVGWTFSDGLILRTDDKLKSTSGMSSGGGNLASKPRSKSVIPIRWTFRDGIVYKVTKVPKNEDGMLEAKSKRVLPIGWSFYDGLTIRPDGSVKGVSKATGKSVEIVPESKSKRMIPIGWTFHEGLIFATNESIKSAVSPRDKSNSTGTEVSSKRLPITWTFHEGLMLGTRESVKSAPISPEKGSGSETEASSKRLPITWTFHDGLSLGTDSKVKDFTKTASESGEIAMESKLKRTVGWTFNDGLIIRNTAAILPNDRELATTSRKRSRPKPSSPADGTEEAAGETAEDAEMEAGDTAEEAEDTAGEAGEGVEALEVDGVEEVAEGVAQGRPVDRSVIKCLEVGEGGENPGAGGELVGSYFPGLSYLCSSQSGAPRHCLGTPVLPLKAKC